MTRLVATLALVFTFGFVTLFAQDAAHRSSSAPATVSASAPVNLNTATAAQLDALPGIGKATAERIIEYRQKSGGFKKTEELMNVQGIGEKNFLKLKPLVTVTMPRAEKTTQE
jgi:competence protein ComEA